MKYSLILFLIISLSGCASYVKQRVQRAPAIVLQDDRTLKVKRFETHGDVSIEVKGKGFMGAIKNIAVNAAANKYLRTHNKNIKKSYKHKIEQSLIDQGYINVVHKGSQAKYRMTGKIDYSVYESSKTVEEDVKKKVNGKVEIHKVTTEKHFHNAKVSVILYIEDKKGNTIGSKTYNATSKAKAYDLSWSNLVLKALDKTVPRIVRTLTPYYEWETFYFEKGDHESVEKGNDAAEEGKWDEALNHWLYANNHGNKEDQIAYQVNAGIHKEVHSQLEQALKFYKRAHQLSGSSKHQGYINRVRRKLDDIQKLDDAQNSLTPDKVIPNKKTTPEKEEPKSINSNSIYRPGK